MAALALKRRTPSLGALPPTPPLNVIETPVPSASITNKPAVQGASLYHTCRSVLDRLALVDGLTEFLDPEALPPVPPTTPILSPSSSTSSSEPTTPTFGCDPLSKLWSICRQGSPLCILFNALCPDNPLKVERDPKLTQVNTCKASVYHFIVACRKQLEFPEDDVFTITDLYQDDTNGFVKVVNTINKILQLMETKGMISVRSSNRNSDPNAPKDTRSKVVMELLETERKYVQDMEILQNYMRELQNQKILSPDTIHYLFGNLNTLVDFQRRFLIQLEDMAEKSAQEQRIGLLFVQMEEAFAVYEPYCANYYSAQDLVVQEAPKLQKLADILNPTYELPSMLIKPVQRICKYPLLMNELIKSTDKEWPHFAEMEQGLEAIKRVAEKVNETQRKHENDQAMEDLKRRIVLENGRSIDTYGSLLLHDKLIVGSSDFERDLCVILFDKVLLLCKDASAKNKLTKSNTISINKKKRRDSLREKGRIFVNSIIGVHNRSQNSSWILAIDWRNPDVEVFTLKLRNEEQLKLWETTLNKVKAQNKIHVPNTHLYSMPSPTNSQMPSHLHSDSASFIDDADDDEEDDDFGQEDEEEIAPTRSRSNSISAQLFNTLAGRPKLHRDNSVDAANWKAQRSFMPGMNLSPLPRPSHSTSTTAYDHGMLPASPPPSHPSSPTSSSRISSGSSTSRRRQETSSDIAYKFMATDIPTPKEEYPLPPPVGRSQSQSTTATQMGFVQHTRMRSQSSPNIHKASAAQAAAAAAAAAAPVPQIPFNSRTVYHREPAVRNASSTPRLSDMVTTSLQSQIERVVSAVPMSPGELKVKLNYDSGVYAIKVAQEVTFAELMEKVERKLGIIANLNPNETLRLKYQDEDGDLITINSDDDVQMAFEGRTSGHVVNIFVNV